MPLGRRRIWRPTRPVITLAGMLRHRLHFGPYRTPLFRIGQRVEDERRGEVRIVGLTAGRIPWPTDQQGRSKAIVLYKGLARAVRREAAKPSQSFCKSA